MLILLTVLFFILTLTILIKTDSEYLFTTCAIVFIVFLILSINTGVDVVNGRRIDDKITMYAEENQNIEAQMNMLIEQYMNYESDTYGDLKGESSIALVSLYPELKADILVTKQIEMYIANNEKLKSLKEEKIDLSAKKWWLYFGN